MRKLGIWLLLPVLIMGMWAGPTRTSADVVTEPSQALSVARQSTNLAQIEATPMVTEPEAPAPASSDPASTAPAKDTGSTTVAPADFPNVCDGSYPPTQQDVTFAVSFPSAYDPSPLEVLIFAQNGGCIRGYEYQVPVSFPEKDDSPYSQTIQLPAGQYVYQYSGDGFETAWGIPFQVVESGSNSVIVTPTAIPAAQTVTLNVTIPEGGSSLVLVITDAGGTVDSATVTESGPVRFKLPAGDYFYQYWGDDYPWSGEIPFKVIEGQETVIDIKPAIPTITLDPVFISPTNQSTTVEVTVQGFRAGDEYELNFNNGQVVQYGEASSSGEISASFPVAPGLDPGKYPVVVTGAVSGQRLEATFTVLGAAQVALNTTSGPAGMVVTVTGSGFAASETVYFRFDSETGPLLGYRDADVNGNVTGRVTIPTSASVAEHQIIASQPSGQRATAAFTVTERIVNVTVSPSSVAPNTVVTVTGSGYAPKEMVDIYWVNTDGPRLGYLEADSSGSFTGRVTVPKTAGTGNYPIQVRGRTSTAVGSATVSVTAPSPQVTVSPTSQTSGKVVGVAGSGFQPGERVDIRWNGFSGQLLGYITAGSSGTVSGKVTVPAGTVPGVYSIVMIQRGGTLSGSAKITVTGATVTVNPTQASPGTVVSVSGSGFGPGEVVDIRWNGASGKLIGYRTTASNGSMSGKVTVPAGVAPGTYTLFLQGRNSGIVGSVTIEVRTAGSSEYPGFVWRPGHSSNIVVFTGSARPIA